MATLKTTVLGIEFENPFLLASAPPTARIDSIDKAFSLGWGGAVLKTITPDDTTIEERIIFIEERLKQHHKGCSFESFFETPSKTEVVTTFMALLEMMKNGQIVAQQEGNYETIMLYLAVGDTKDDKIK